MHSNYRERILGGLRGAAVGDSLGAITETLTRRQIRELYGWLDDYRAPVSPPYGQERIPGEITDDASLIIAMMESAAGTDRLELAPTIRGLMQWADDPRYSRYAGPSTKRAIQLIRAGANPLEVGKGDVNSFTGASNGGAMKSAPAGWAARGNIELAVHNAAVICGPTHNTQVAIAGAAAIAAGCTAALSESATVATVIAAAIDGATRGHELGLSQGREVAAPNVERRILQAMDLVDRNSVENTLENLANQIGCGLSTSESVPVALAIFALAEGDPTLCAIYSANVGDDTDTIGCMAGALGGTYSTSANLPNSWIDLIDEANNINTEAIADRFIDNKKDAS